MIEVSKLKRFQKIYVISSFSDLISEEIIKTISENEITFEAHRGKSSSIKKANFYKIFTSKEDAEKNMNFVRLKLVSEEINKLEKKLSKSNIEMNTLKIILDNLKEKIK